MIFLGSPIQERPRSDWWPTRHPHRADDLEQAGELQGRPARPSGPHRCLPTCLRAPPQPSGENFPLCHRYAWPRFPSWESPEIDHVGDIDRWCPSWFLLPYQPIGADGRAGGVRASGIYRIWLELFAASSTWRWPLLSGIHVPAAIVPSKQVCSSVPSFIFVAVGFFVIFLKSISSCVFCIQYPQLLFIGCFNMFFILLVLYWPDYQINCILGPVSI